MPKTHSSQPFIKWVAVAAVLVILSACGGGGGSSPPPSNPTPTPTPTPTPDPDTTPEAFTFTAVSDAERGASVLSGTVTITGIDTETSVSVENGEFSIGGAEFTSEAGTVENGDEIVLRTTASSEFATSIETVLTVGGVSGTFTVTTEAQDVTPEPFSFNPQVAEPDLEVTSNVVVVEGINDAALINVTGGAYSIEGGEYTDMEGTVSAGQSVAVRGTSAVESGDVEVTLSIGGVEGVFTITTDATAPTVEIHYPPKLSLTTDTTVRVRGVASDDLSPIAGITVNGVQATSEDDFATWIAEISLAVDTTNAVTVVASDAFGNTDSTAATANIVRRSDISDSFMDEDGYLSHPIGLVLHPNTGDLIISNRMPSGIYILSLEDNTISVLSDPTFPNDENVIPQPSYMVVDTMFNPTPRLLVADRVYGSITAIDPDSGQRTPFVAGGEETYIDVSMAIDTQLGRLLVADPASDDSGLFFVDLVSMEQEPLFSNPEQSSPLLLDGRIRGMTLDVEGRIAYVVGGSVNQSVWAVNMDNGSHVVLSDDETPNTEYPFEGLSTRVILDADRGRLVIANEGGDFYDNSSSIMAVNLDSEQGLVGAREPISDDTPDPPNAAFPTEGIENLLLDDEKDIVYMSSSLPERTAILVMDLSTGQRVFLVKGPDAEL